MCATVPYMEPRGLGISMKSNLRSIAAVFQAARGTVSLRWAWIRWWGGLSGYPPQKKTERLAVQRLAVQCLFILFVSFLKDIYI